MPKLPPQDPRELHRVSLEEISNIVTKAIPVIPPGLVFHPASGAFYVIAKHPLALERVIVRIPFADFANCFGGLLGQLLIPMLTEMQSRIEKGTVPPELGGTAPKVN